jgi:hypothetical protein
MARQKNTEIHARALGPSELVESAPREHVDRNTAEYIGMAAEIAKDTIYVRNTRWEGAEKHFPTDPDMRTVDKFFQYAAGGPLHVDSPETKGEVARCEKKATAMKLEGLRYCYIGPDMSIDDVRAQLDPKEADVGVV